MDFRIHVLRALSFSGKTIKKSFWPLFIDGVQLSQSYRATARKQFIFYHYVPENFWYSFDRPWKDVMLS